MPNTRIIGDVHCKIWKYIPLISYCQKSIQLGDFGFKEEWDWLERAVNPNNHKIIPGNHDYIPYLNKPHSLGNWSYHDRFFCIRGADSIDRKDRIIGRDLFLNEEMNMGECNETLDNYERIKPKIVISHDCPSSVAETLFGFPTTGINRDIYKSTTRSFLQALLEIHEPKMWVFGHHHKPLIQQINNTKFICLGELNYIDIDPDSI